MTPLDHLIVFILAWAIAGPLAIADFVLSLIYGDPGVTHPLPGYGFYRWLQYRQWLRGRK